MDVMIEVENKMKAGNPLVALEGPIQAFRDAVNQEQIHHDQIWGAQHDICEQEGAFREKEITEQSNILRDSTNALDSCQSQKVRAQNELDVNEQQTFVN
jgi:hypothetical protein